MSKFVLVDVEAVKAATKKPVKANIGEDCEAWFRKVSMEEFFEIQGKLSVFEEAAKHDENDLSATREFAKKYRDILVELAISLLTNEKGDPAFKPEDKESLAMLVTSKFSKEFIQAFMQSQGIDKEDLAKAEDSFRQKS